MESPSLPGYRLLRLLGGGKNFHVWEARGEEDDAPVAVKFPRAAALENPSTIILMRREARAGQTVHHPRLVQVLDAHLLEEPYFLVMELLPGESLKERLERFGRLSARRSIWIGRQLAEGLSALHRAGFVHADIKPGNILINDRGEVKLIDLGFSHCRGENQKLIEAGFTIGTANYLAPELCTKPVREGPPADVFALGATLFECLTGRVPYPAETVREAIQLRRKRRPLHLTDLKGKWPEPVVRVVGSMLAREPQERPTAATLVRELFHIEQELMSKRQAAAPRRTLRSMLGFTLPRRRSA